MDSEIKRLLQLSSIPNFKLSKKDQKTLDEWKAAQEPIKLKKPRTRKKTTNEVKLEEKETGTLEIEEPVIEISTPEES